MAALYVRFWGSHPYVRHTNVLTCRSSSDSALWERGVSVFWPVLSQGSANAKVARRKPTRPGPVPGLEVAHDILPHSPGYRQADWHDWGAPGAILLSTKTLRKISKCRALFLRPRGGPICPVWGVPPIRATYQCAHLPSLQRFRPVGARIELFLNFRSLKVGVSQR